MTYMRTETLFITISKLGGRRSDDDFYLHFLYTLRRKLGAGCCIYIYVFRFVRNEIRAGDGTEGENSTEHHYIVLCKEDVNIISRKISRRRENSRGDKYAELDYCFLEFCYFRTRDSQR